MNFKRYPFAIPDKNIRDFDNAKGYSNLVDLIKERGISTDLADYWYKEFDM